MNIIELLQTISKSKEIKRAGWVRKKIPNPESIAEHSFQVAILALFMSEWFNVDSNKLVKMAIVHDLAECVVGDITPKEYSSVSKKEKFKQEEKAVRHLLKGMPHRQQNEIYELWLEYNKGLTDEAKLMQELDKLEMAFQALDYETQTKIDLSEFFETTEKNLSTLQLVEILEELKSMRKKK